MASFIPRFLRHLRDVVITAPSDGEALLYDISDGKWKNAAAGGSGDLSDAVILAPASSARNVIQPTAGAVIAAIVKAHAAQSVDLTQWQKSDGTVLAAIDQVQGALRLGSSLNALLVDAGFSLNLSDTGAWNGTGNGITYFGTVDGTQSVAIRLGSTGQFLWEFKADGTTVFPSSILPVWFMSGAGTPVGNVTPSQVGATYQDTTGGGLYVALTAGDDGWVQVGGLSLSATDPLPGIGVVNMGTNTPTEAAFRVLAGSAGAVWLTDYASYAAGGLDNRIEFVANGIDGQQFARFQLGSTGQFAWMFAADGSTSLPGALLLGTDLALADGGTGSSTAAGARTNLGLVIGTDVASQASDDAKVAKSLYDANTVLAANADDTPLALTMGASTILARLAAGNIKAATPAEIITLLTGVPRVIASGTLGADAANIDLTGISGSYSLLKLLLYLRGTTAAVTVNTLIRFNGDTGANYDYQRQYADATSSGASSGVAQTSMLIVPAPGANAPASSFGSIEMDVFGYATTTGHKATRSNGYLRYDTTKPDSERWGGDWRSTAAITQITITPAAGNWLAGSAYVLIGV